MLGLSFTYSMNIYADLPYASIVLGSGGTAIDTTGTDPYLIEHVS